MGERPTGRVAVITGASGGIGGAVARALAEDGYRLALLDAAAPPAQLAADVEALGGPALFVSVDVADEGSVLAAREAVRRELGPAACLVNGAGIYPRALALEEPVELWQRVLAVNLTGAFLCARAFARDMLEAGRGCIVNFASERALVPSPRSSHYAASKGGLISLTRALALEWAPAVRVNAIIPGVTDTAMPRLGVASDEELYARAARIPLGRIGQPRDVAQLVRFLASDAAEYITGQSLCVNGGAVMH
jgi:NAD(P)-dependent dehydrogenase (short-subunit alcohol dehydrogenase family)